MEKAGIAVDKIYLYGSYAGGDQREDSDLDVAVISPSFSGKRFQDAMKLRRIRREIDNRIEPIPFRPEDFKEEHPLVAEIKAKGVALE